MAALRFDIDIYSIVGIDGEILPGATLTFYQRGTTTLQATYSDEGLTVANTNPVLADAGGRFGDIFLQAKAYKVILKDPDGVTLRTIEPVYGYIPASGATVGGVDTIAALKALKKAALADGAYASVGGYYNAGDGGGGIFRWSAASAVTANLGTIFASDDGGTGRWFRMINSPISVMWFGATATTGVDDYAAFDAAAVYCRNSGQRALYLPQNGYEISQPWNISGIDVYGDGANASTVKAHATFVGSYLLVQDSSTDGGAAQKRLSSFGLNGNLGTVAGVGALTQIGDVLHNTAVDLLMKDMGGACIDLVPAYGSRPTQSGFENIRVSNTFGTAVRARGGRYINFDRCNFEQMGGKAVDIDGSGETPAGFKFDNCYIEKCGDGFDAVTVEDCVGFKWDLGNVQEYGDLTGTSGNGFVFTDCYEVDLASPAVSGRAASSATSKKIVFSGGARNRVRLALNGFGSVDVETNGTDVTFEQAYIGTISSTQQINTSHVSTLAAANTYYLQPGTSQVSSVITAMNVPALSQMTIVGIRASSSTLPGGSDSYTVTLVKNNVPTGLSGVLSNANGANTSSFAADVVIEAGDSYVIQVQTSATAAALTAGALKVVLGII